MSRAAGFDDDEIAKAVLMRRLLVDIVLNEPMKTTHLLIVLALLTALILVGCGAKETTPLAVPEGAHAGDLTGLKDCEFQHSGSKAKYAAECGRLGYAVLAWKDRYWSIASRVYYTLVTIAAIAFVWFLNYWNLLGWRY